MCRKLIEWLYLRQKNNLAYHDGLTGIFNRMYYHRELIKKYNDKECLVIVLDLNNLKKINDTKGHNAGNQLLIYIADTLKSFGIACRLGGDEFLLLMNEEKLDDFKAFADSNKDFCYAYMKKEKNDGLEYIFEKVDQELVSIKTEYRKTNAR